MSDIPKKPTQEKIASDIEDPSCWPIAVDEEKALLGAALMGRASEITKIFNVTDFAISTHRAVFAAIAACVEAGEGDNTRLEFAAVASALAANKKLEEVGGFAFLCGLTDGVVAARPLQFRLKRLRELAGRRAGLRLTEELRRRFADLGCDFEETMAFLREKAIR